MPFVGRGALLSLLLAAAPAWGEPAPTLATRPDAAGWPAPPFRAWVAVGLLTVRAAPDPHAGDIGLLNYGDVVTVTRCVPACRSSGAWAMLAERGAVRLALLQLPPESDAAAAQSSTARFIYGRVRWRGGQAYEEPDVTSRKIGRAQKAGHDLAFRVDEPLRARGWLRRPAGAYMPLAGIKLHHASAYAGAHDPPPAVALLVRAAPLRPDPGSTTAPVEIARHAYLPALGFAPGGRVRVPGGTLPRGAVRIAIHRPRPAAIPAGARWVHVDLREQTLTAYEGDKLVFATLVTTGKPGYVTPAGLYRVWHKTIHAAMHGEPDDPYFVDEVPWVLFIRKGVALHGTFWHDNFGERASHGCINLSLADAEWIFDWAPPPLPAGWHGIEPVAANLPSLWVVVDKAARVDLPAHLAASER